MTQKVELGKIYKASRSPGGNYYFIPRKNGKVTIYLSDHTGEIFSTGDKDKSAAFVSDFILTFGPLKMLSIDEEAKNRLLINIFHSEEEC